MKRNVLFKFIIISFGAFMWMSSSAGRAADTNQGNTGAPGDAVVTCATASCHGNTTIQVSMDIVVLDQSSNPISSYAPGETYRVRVTVNHVGGNSPVAFGYQLVALTDSNNSSTESFSNPASNVQIAMASSTGRTYAEQNGPSNTNSFLVDWTAPTAGSGSVTFYSAGNGVNGNGMSSGDGANSTTHTIQEGTSSTQNPIAEKWALNLFPNPVQSTINITADHQLDGPMTATIIDVAGRVIRSQQVTMNAGQLSMDADDLSRGQYALILQNENEKAVVKFSKL